MSQGKRTLLLLLDTSTQVKEWKIFRGEVEEVGVKIELAIFGVLVEEVLLDLVQL